MAWIKLEEQTCHPERAAVPTTLVTWKCRGCGALAVTSGSDPGPCGKRSCHYSKGLQ